MAEVERVPRNRSFWIGAALLGIAAIVAVLIAVLWPRPATVPREVPVDASLPPAPDRAAADAPAATPPDSATVPAKKAPRPANRRLSDGELREVQRRGTPLLRSCTERRRLEATGNKKVTVLVELAAGGRVTSVVVDAGRDQALAQCLRRMVASWRFPTDLKAQKVVFPLLLGGAE